RREGVQRERAGSQPGRLNEVSNELDSARAWIDREPAMHDNLVAKSQRVMLTKRLSTKHHTLQAAIVVSQIEVDVSGRRATHIAHFAFEPEISIERVRF